MLIWIQGWEGELEVVPETLGTTTLTFHPLQGHLPSLAPC